ncbi:hypothetical protein BJX61DRAFT_552175 [Aspergillus egyptiacus]|nr:hypothetical protein BJX61DRAFT_552175 [Aspergillus egyptiacus]
MRRSLLFALLTRLGFGIGLALALPAPGEHAPGTPELETETETETVDVHWLGDTPTYTGGLTFGLPWPQGKYRFNETVFSMAGASGRDIPLQSWVNGYWADGSIKWTGHAIPAGVEGDEGEEGFRVPANGDGNGNRIRVADSRERVTVDTGKITVTFPKQGGKNLVESIETADGKVVGANGKLVLHTQAETAIEYANFESRISNVTVIRGTHAPVSGERDGWLQFVVRFYLIVFDGDAERDFISGLGIRFSVPLEGEKLYNRHVRIPGEDGGFLLEAVQGITGLRRDPGEEVRSAQVEGNELPGEESWDTRVTERLHWIPVWNDYQLSQLSPDGFTVRKRTKPGQGWVTIPGGSRSHGLTYLGGATKGGLAVGLRDFWKRYPTGVDISDAGTDQGQITIWLYSPDAPPLDLRPFHDGMGQDTYEKQLDALEITYEDYEPGFNTPYGIARTSEIYLYAFDQTPSSEHLATLSSHTNNPPILMPSPSYIHSTKALGTYWSLPDTSTRQSSAIESNMDFLIRFYSSQVASRRWYGFLDHGDFMHTYDADRHIWRYDIGGYAWDNSELSPDLFLWQYFLRTGREDVYRLAEALTRHTGEVDVYHIGDWKGLGTRHGVQHFADSAKQVRITQPQYRKYFFYLSGGDERTGDLLTEALDTDQTYGVLDPNRKVRTDGWTPTPGDPTAISLGTDWAGLAGGWLIEWERMGPRWSEAHRKLTGTANGIVNLTNGFVTGSALYRITDGTLSPPPSDPENQGLVEVSHLNAVFGMPEVISELLDHWGADAPSGLRDVWLDYCYYYSASKDEQASRYGQDFGSLNLFQGHSRLTAMFAHEFENTTVAERAWDEFYHNSDGFTADQPWRAEVVNGSAVLVPVEEASWVSTNAMAQYGLAAIQNLALVGGVVGVVYP